MEAPILDSSATFRAKEEGYAYLYISNENPTAVDAYFDDVTMTYTPTRVIQYNDYYPFGLQTANSWVRANATTNNFLANGGTELNPTTQLYDLDFRNYDPALARLHQADPLADLYSSHTPYNFAGNNPVSTTDPTGAYWSRDWEGNYMGTDFGNKKWRMSMPISFSADQYLDEYYDDYLGHFNLAATGFGFGSLYTNPSIMADAAWGEQNACNWVSVNGQKPTAGVRYSNLQNAANVYSYVVPQNGGSYGVGGLVHVSSTGSIIYMSSQKVKLASNGAWEGIGATSINVFGEVLQNNGNVPGDGDNWWSNFKTATGMTLDWMLGDGPESRSFYNDNVAAAMKNAWRVNQARDFFYNKYKDAANFKGANVTNYKGEFGIQGLIRAGLDPIEQFVGSYTVNIYASPNGKDLTFVLWNNSSVKSLLYGIGPSWGRESYEPGSNMYQSYIWTEPVRK